MEIIKVKSTHPESQGPFVLLYKSDFDPAKHELYEAAPKGEEAKASAGGDAPEPTAAELKAALDATGIAYRGNASIASLKALLNAAPKGE